MFLSRGTGVCCILVLRMLISRCDCDETATLREPSNMEQLLR